MTPDDTGVTRLERNSRFNRAEVTPEEPSVPDDVEYLLHWFDALSGTRRISESGPMGLAPSDVYAWSMLTGNAITPVEYTLLGEMDVAFLRAASEFRRELEAKYKTEKTAPRGAPKT